MEAKIQKEGDVTIVHLRGRLDFESSEPFRKTCLQDLTQEKVIFNLNELSFVGSSGVTDFVDTIVSLSEKNDFGVKCYGVSSEFKKIFETRSDKGVEIYDDEMTARKAFEDQGQNQAPGNILPQDWTPSSTGVDLK